MKIKKSSIMFLFLIILISLPILFVVEQEINMYISIVVLVELVGAIRVLHGLGYSYFSLPILFVLFTTIFHFGEAFLLALGRYDLFSYTNIDLARTMETYNLANLFAILVEAFMVLGITLKTRQKPQIICDKGNEESVELERAFLIGIILFVLGIVPTYMNYSQQIKHIMEGNMYAGIRETVDIGPIGLLGNFYQVGIFLILIGSKNHKIRARIILIAALIFEVICMLSGNRSSQILRIIALLFIYYRIIQKITPKKIVVFSVIGYVAVIVLYFISVYRNSNLADLSLLKSRIIEIAGGEPFFELLAQLGANLNVVVLTLVSIPAYNNYNLGLTYIISWCAIYPNTGGLLGNIPNMYAFLNYLDTVLPLGGSYIGELYFNFGWFGIVFAIFIGMFIGWSSLKVENAIVQRKWIQLGNYMVLFYSLLWWVRDYFSGWIFRTVWCGVAVWFLNKLLKSKKITRISLSRK